jgi:transcriptional regulator with XRE-family HTH domain
MANSINDRVAQIISDQGITRTKFADSIHVSVAFISALCSGVKQPSDRTILDICRVYGVSELWLREGQGEMYVQRTLRQEILDLARSLSQAPPGDLRRDFLLALADLPPEFWPKLADFMEGILARRADDPGT